MGAATWATGSDQAMLARLEGDLSALGERLATARASEQGPLPELEAPAFGLLVLQAARERWLLVGERRFHYGPLPVLDWRSSPLARVFLTHQEGEDYEIEQGERTLEGQVITRWLLGFDQGRLVRVDTADGRWSRQGSDPWVHTHRLLPHRSLDRPPGGTDRGLVLPDALLDEEQREVMDAPPESVMLVEGAAGSGKTTVCLRRMVTLSRTGASDHPPELSVVVPEEGLAALCRRALEGHGSPNLPVHSFRSWVLGRGRGCFTQLPHTACPDTPFRVRRFFRHPALLAFLPAWVDERADELVMELDRTLFARGALLRQWGATDAEHPAQRLRRTERAWRARRPDHDRKRISAAFERTRRDLRDPRTDWAALWQDRRLLERVADLSEGDLGPADVQAVLDHAWLQFSERSEQAFAHVDAERLKTVDGLSLDAGTPDEAAGTIDLEAWSVLLALHILAHGRPEAGDEALPVTDHLMVDEIQERASVELFVLASMRRAGAGITMSGDRAQRMDASGGLATDTSLTHTLGADTIRHVLLHHAHRSTMPIARFCHDLLGPLAPPEPPSSEHDGPPVQVSVYSGPGEVLAAMAGTLATGFAPTLDLAIIAHEQEAASEIASVVAELAPTALVLDGHFDPGHRGVTVTTVDQVGGLEFDAVWIPDADSASYPQRDGARRKLYVACSRARRVLWVLAPGRLTEILRLAG